MRIAKIYKNSKQTLKVIRNEERVVILFLTENIPSSVINIYDSSSNL